MGDQVGSRGRLSMHGEVRSWLADLRRADPERARLVGEALLATLDTGRRLGPPLLVALESEVRLPPDPAGLDSSYQRQLDALQLVRRAIADIATSRKRIELQVGQLEQGAKRQAAEIQDVPGAGPAEPPAEARGRLAPIRQQLAAQRRQLAAMAAQEEELTASSQRLQARVDAFRTKKEVLKARYTAVSASRMVRDALRDAGDDAADLDLATAEREVSSAFASATATADEVLRDAGELARKKPRLRGRSRRLPNRGSGPPAGLMELRPGSPGDPAARLLLVLGAGDDAEAGGEPRPAAGHQPGAAIKLAGARVESRDETEPALVLILAAWAAGTGGPADQYRAAWPGATERLAVFRRGRESDAAAFTSYDPDSFLDEFFPGEETEVELGAAALAARSRAHTLAEARQRLGLTQAQVAERMNVRQERVSAIERAEPGAAEVRTLAAYVRALGGRLEIVADIGLERILLR